ncbi:hypothetical protein GOBAR_AA20919 [Gossypium barbadense]|uniref:AB hydrolase-1 domain-containing protein n=1 Tax=Gossypium barbadense TaxID=3634 RepID=A0A2P5X8T2_GOSBA|nr:hypothetical protein GOBAR_AA20919 [Gossypium barbadense]
MASFYAPFQVITPPPPRVVNFTIRPTPIAPTPSLKFILVHGTGRAILFAISVLGVAVLVLVHGFGANSNHLRENIPVLAKSHRVYAIVLIGYGYSDKPNPREVGDSFYTFETWGSQLNDFCSSVVKDKAFFI